MNGPSRILTEDEIKRNRQLFIETTAPIVNQIAILRDKGFMGYILMDGTLKTNIHPAFQKEIDMLEERIRDIAINFSLLPPKA